MNTSLSKKARSPTDYPTQGAGPLASDLRYLLDRHARPFDAKKLLLLQGDESSAVIYVIDGWLALTKSLENGEKQIIDFALPGDIVDPSAADGTTAAINVQAQTDGNAAVVPRATWEELLRSWPRLYELTQNAEAATLARRAERMLRLGKGTAEMRVAYALIEFCIRLDPTLKRSTPGFHIPITQQQLGDFIGLSSVHVCRTLRRLVRNEILSVEDHMDIQFHEKEALARIAGIAPADLRREIIPDGK